VAAAFDFIPRVASDGRTRQSVVTVAGGFGDGKAFLDEPFVDHVGGNLVFDSGPDFVQVEDDVSGASALAPSADDQALVFGAGKETGRVEWRRDRFRPTASCVSALSSIVANPDSEWG
jgi:uncharacterized membrane protein YoaK (UPF0700 family)